MAYAPTLAWKGLEGPEEAHLVATATSRMAKYAEFLKDLSGNSAKEQLILESSEGTAFEAADDGE